MWGKGQQSLSPPSAGETRSAISASVSRASPWRSAEALHNLQDQQVQVSLGEAVLLAGRSFCDSRTPIETESECLGEE